MRACHAALKITPEINEGLRRPQLYSRRERLFLAAVDKLCLTVTPPSLPATYPRLRTIRDSSAHLIVGYLRQRFIRQALFSSIIASHVVLAADIRSCDDSLLFLPFAIFTPAGGSGRLFDRFDVDGVQ